MMETSAPEAPVMTALDRLEILLHRWEEILLLAQAFFTLQVGCGDPEAAQCLMGSVIYGQLLRKELLARRRIDSQRFSTPEHVINMFFAECFLFDRLPFTVNMWDLSYRRVYDLSPDLQRSLESTSLGKITLRDITAPFPAFGMYLPIPVPWKQAGWEGTIDLLLIEVMEDEIKIIALGPDTKERKFFPREKKFRIMRAIRDKELRFLRTIVTEPGNDRHFETSKVNFLSIERSEKTIMEAFTQSKFSILTAIGEEPAHEEPGQMPEHWRLILQIVFGLCLHLEMVAQIAKNGSHSRESSSEILIGSWKKQQIRNHNLPAEERSIAEGASICRIELASPLVSADREYHNHIRADGFESAIGKMPQQFRTRHWRRWPGTGHDPAAPKCVYVKPYKTHQSCSQDAQTVEAQAVA